MAGAALGPERERFEFRGERIETVSLSRRAIDNLLAIGSPSEIGDVSLRCEYILLAQHRDVDNDDCIVRPVALDLHYACEQFFTRAEYRLPVTAEAALLGELLAVTLRFNPTRCAHFVCRSSRNRSGEPPRFPQAQRRSFSAGRC